MLFHSFEFIFVFLPIVLVGFFALSKTGRPTLPIIWLIAASFFFYGWWKWSLVWLLLASVTVNFVLGQLLAADHRRGTLVAGIVFNLGLLGWAKYAGFFAITVNAIASTSFNFGEVVLPLAISFFTYKQIAYLVDVYPGLARLGPRDGRGRQDRHFW